MPSLAGFSDNAFQTRQDMVTAAEALLKPLLPYFSPGKARIKIPVHSGAHFDETAAQLEGYARPLWVVGALLVAQQNESSPRQRSKDLLRNWMDGLENGVNPDHDEYWGPIGDWDQRMVEAEIISFTLLSAPERMYAPLTQNGKENLTNWLKGLNGKVMPENNWRWFRVLSNLALIKVCGVDRDELWPFIEQDMVVLESFYISDGWASDGVWRPVTDDPETEGTGPDAARGRHADYYSGSFALQFSQMLYAKHAADIDPERAKTFIYRAKQFARTFWAYFDTNGSAIPFGRSLCYKFAMGGFYAAFAHTGLCDESEPFCSHGEIKGMLLRHLRWWATHSEHILNQDGTLNIGYLYPNMYVSEHYNSPQSPYWAVKTLIAISLAENDPFWTTETLPHPLQKDDSECADVHTVAPAKQIVCNKANGQHHFMLSSGQFCVWSMKATEAKYAKFAYSSAFGFSVPTGPSLSQLAPDSTLALSRDDGETWAVRWKTIGDTKIVPIDLDGSDEQATAFVSRWKPWKYEGVDIESTLIAPCSRWPDWHVRIHRITYSEGSAFKPLAAVEGGFAIDGERKADGRMMKPVQTESKKLFSICESSEMATETETASFVLSRAGASGVLELSGPRAGSRVTGEVLVPDPNTNLMARRTLIPTVKHELHVEGQGILLLATAVFAVDFTKGALSVEEVQRRWSQRPSVTWKSDETWSLH